MSTPKEVKNIYQRILGIMADIDYIQKGSKKAGGMYTYVSHDQVSEAIHPLLVKHGVVVIPTVKSLVQDGNKTVMCLSVAFINADMPSDQFTIESWGYGIDTGDKGPGKCFSYSYKYALLKTFCLETGDDPDHDQDVKYEPAKISEEQFLSIQAYDNETTASYKAQVLKALKIKSYMELPAEKFDAFFDKLKSVYAERSARCGS